ncbi:uncharacterized protein GIQ15_04886 [Arthroderma uncinatum]|uniref:uncharacterized protein n=1 Tax=Arthroderma uncinatum TaxID=74035 RepID=UPI00144A6D93|nr:uncharacterized protein GIQ15_04886 [Arthroderma uncinatum]KAF3482127.1 hypothetical protein GIQ15_04886 [Arthroderma uncinatum]
MMLSTRPAGILRKTLSKPYTIPCTSICSVPGIPRAGLQRAISTSPLLSKGASGHGPKALLLDKQHGLGFVKSNSLPPKPRKRGVTEIRGPYYAVMGKRYLSDIFETMGDYIDGLKFSGGSFSLFHEAKLKELIDIAHENGAYVSTGGWAEHLLTHPDNASVLDRYFRKCKDLGFDVVELSAGFLSIPEDDWLRLVERVQSYGLKPKPELGIQFGAGGDTETKDLEEIGTSDPGKLINLGKRFLDAGVERLMIESEGITENVTDWKTDVVSQIMKGLPQEQVMFEG